MTPQSTTPHTPEPWRLDGNDIWNTNVEFTGVEINRRCDTPLAKRNLERIVACVNACAGMADPAADLARTRAALEGYLALHEDLAGALGSKMCECQECCTARAALAAAEKEGA